MATPLLAWVGQPQKDAGLPASTMQPAAPTEIIGLGELTSRMTVPVSVDGNGPYDFIIDTGAERSVVSHELAAMLGLNPGAPARLLDFAGASTVKTVRVPLLSAGSLSTGAFDAPSLAAINLGAPGMLGIDALQGRKLVIDFEHNRMTVSPAGRRINGDFVVRAVARDGQLIFTKASFNGQPVSVIVDTGSWFSVGNTAMLKLAANTIRRVGPVAMRSVTGGLLRADFVEIRNMHIGGVGFDHFGLIFADVPPFARFGLADKPALILGLSTLKLFRRVELDFTNRKIGFSLPLPQGDPYHLCRDEDPRCSSFPGL